MMEMWLVSVWYVFAVDMTFTPMNVLRAVREVKDTDFLGYYVGVPASKRDEIQSQFSSEAQQRKAYIKYFIEHDPEASWRRVICVLEEMDKPDSVQAADNIRHLAEAVPGRAVIYNSLVLRPFEEKGTTVGACALFP